jgi:hypothetical protein
MRQMSIERVDAVDEPATGHRWVIAKRSKQTTKAQSEAADKDALAKAAIEELLKDTDLDVSEDAAAALSALADAHGLTFTLAKDDEDEPEADNGDGDESDESDESDADDADADEQDGEGDDEQNDADEGDSDDEDNDLAKRIGTLEKAVELLIERFDDKPGDRPKVEPTLKARRRRTSKQVTGQDNLDGGEPLAKSDGRVSYENVVFGQ